MGLLDRGGKENVWKKYGETNIYSNPRQDPAGTDSR